MATTNSGSTTDGNTDSTGITSASTSAPSRDRDLVALAIATDLAKAALPGLVTKPTAERIEGVMTVVAVLSYRLADALAAARVRIPPPVAAPAADGVFDGPATS